MNQFGHIEQSSAAAEGVRFLEIGLFLVGDFVLTQPHER